jgi:hypothetical protein
VIRLGLVKVPARPAEATLFRQRDLDDARGNEASLVEPLDLRLCLAPGGELAGGGRFRTMAPTRARALAAYPAPKVTRLPRPGWRLLRAGFAPAGSRTGTEAGNPPGRDLVEAVYAAAWSACVVDPGLRARALPVRSGRSASK